MWNGVNMIYNMYTYLFPDLDFSLEYRNDFKYQDFLILLLKSV